MPLAFPGPSEHPPRVPHLVDTVRCVAAPRTGPCLARVCARSGRENEPAVRRICEAIQLVFAKYRELWSVRQTFQWFRDHDMELPANPIQGTRLVWKIPSQSLIRDILCNPFYAGAYVWGRRPVTTLLVDGRLEKRQSAMRPAEECRWSGPRFFGVNKRTRAS